MRPLYVPAWDGLGDNLYLRPFVRRLAAGREVYVRTPWPEIYQDLPVRFVRPDTRLRTQRKNVERQPAARWSSLPSQYEEAGMYIHCDSPSIPDGIAQAMRMSAEGLTWDLPDFGASPVRTRRRPIAVVRPVVVRAEWQNEARNPLPEYVAAAARILRRSGYYVVSVADLEPGAEWMLAPPPVADRAFYAGELTVDRLLALVQHAAVVVGGVGWIVPAAISAGTPLVVIGGGNGAHNRPGWLVGGGMDASRTRFLLPDNYCMCARMQHGCDKRISDFEDRFAAALAEVTRG